METDELACEAFAANPADRCYHCKGELFDRILALAASRGIDTVYDATNTDDLSDYRPGRRATEERGVTSPLLLAGLAKKDVRRLSKRLGLPSWNKPANPCLASRVPYGTPITLEVLDKIRAGEKFIRGLGFAVVRLRHHDRLARIEVPAADFARLMKPATARRIAAKLRSLGYLWIALDIEGFRTGSLNRAVAEGPAKKPQ
ncbi:MAG: ATP-dependent sacrificial sulfur transferase LarE [Candidatus Moduliflexus flocculans]|nr:ATP-dependent sacrificial sulfur transferase LarE [Candidatus Moduliflexus flocculans]